jgi:hypothetical protein
MAVVRAVRDIVLGSDPGLQRARTTLRIGLGIAASSGVLFALQSLVPFGAPEMVLAGILTMFGSNAANGPRSQRLVTVALLPFALAGGAASAAATAPLAPIAGDLVFLAIIFAGVAARRFGPRGTVLGIAPVMGFFMARFLQVSLAAIPLVLVAVAIATAITILVREVIVPDAPRWTLGVSLASFRAQRRVLARTALRGGAKARERVRSAVYALNAAANTVDTLLSRDDIGLRASRREQLRDAVTGAELTAEHASGAAIGNDEGGRSPGRTALQAILAGRQGDAERIVAQIARSQQGRKHDTRLMHLERRVLPPIPAEIKQAVQATLASAAALVIGRLISPTRWYWAVLAAFIVFAGTASAGETVQKLWGRVAGTALGVAAGIAVAALVGRDKAVDTAIIIVVAGVGLYLRPLSYGAMVFAITAVLGLLYSMLGRSVEPILLLRLEETGVGAFFAGLAATVLFPVRTQNALAPATDRYLDELEASVTASVAALCGEPAETSPQDASRALDAALGDLIARASPVLTGLPWLNAADEQRAAIAGLTACSFYARRLARLAQRGPAGECEHLRVLAGAVHDASESLRGRAPRDGIRAVDRRDATPPGNDLASIVSTLQNIA